MDDSDEPVSIVKADEDATQKVASNKLDEDENERKADKTINACKFVEEIKRKPQLGDVNLSGTIHRS